MGTGPASFQASGEKCPSIRTLFARKARTTAGSTWLIVCPNNGRNDDAIDIAAITETVNMGRFIGIATHFHDLLAIMIDESNRAVADLAQRSAPSLSRRRLRFRQKLIKNLVDHCGVGFAFGCFHYFAEEILAQLHLAALVVGQLLRASCQYFFHHGANGPSSDT